MPHFHPSIHTHGKHCCGPCFPCKVALSCAHVPCAGDTDGYTGEAVNPENLSLWERMTGVGARYCAVRAASKTVDSALRASGKAARSEPARNGKA